MRHHSPQSPITGVRALLVMGWLILSQTGCGHRIDWPTAASSTTRDQDGAEVRAFAVGGKRVNYWQRLEDGRVVDLRFDEDGDGGPDLHVAVRHTQPEWPHFVIILDGVPFDLLQRMYDEGRFRLFPRPTRMVSVFPAMTDLALSRILRSPPCNGIESQFYDRTKNAVTSGNDVYLRGGNAPWLPFVQYAAPQHVAINSYLNPPSVFYAELREMHRLFNRTGSGRAIAYSVGSAGMGTRRGEAGIREYLAAVDRLVERVTYDKRGRVRFSLLADHGQNRHELRRISLKPMLESAGFRITKALQRPEDVVVIEYGLVTSVALHTRRPAEVAAALIGHPSVELAAYLEVPGNSRQMSETATPAVEPDVQPPDDAIVVQSREGVARIRKRPGGWLYDMSEGDPLQLAVILNVLRETAQISGEGVIDDRSLFQATVTHRYPDPLHRLWEAFHGLVRNPADVYVSLANDACHGSKFFHFFIAPVASTHGSLDYASSVTFIMSNYANRPLPEAIRVDDAMDWLSEGVVSTAPAERRPSRDPHD